MSKEEKKTTKGRGRKKLYSDKMLMDIIEQYLIANPDTTELVANRIATFAQDELNIKNIRYSQFTQCQTTKEYIAGFNAEHLKVVPIRKVDKSKPLKLNTDALIDKYITNPQHLKVALRQFGDKYNEMTKESITNTNEIYALNSEIQELKNTILGLQQELKEVKKEKAILNKEKAELTQRAIHGEKISKYLTSIDVYGDLVTKCKANPIDEVNLKIILYNAGLLKDDEHLDFTNFLDEISYIASSQELIEDDETDEVDDEVIEDNHEDKTYFENTKTESDFLNRFKNISKKNK